MKLLLYWALGSAYILYDFKRALGELETIHWIYTLICGWIIAPLILVGNVYNRLKKLFRREVGDERY